MKTAWITLLAALLLSACANMGGGDQTASADIDQPNAAQQAAGSMNHEAVRDDFLYR